VPLPIAALYERASNVRVPSWAPADAARGCNADRGAALRRGRTSSARGQEVRQPLGARPSRCATRLTRAFNAPDEVGRR
jgi:hypothetical protein